MIEAFGGFAAERLRPAATRRMPLAPGRTSSSPRAPSSASPSSACPRSSAAPSSSAPPSPRPDHRGARPRRHGPGLRRLAPAAVSTALGLWGDADQQAPTFPVHRRGRAGGGARRPRAAASLRPLRARDRRPLRRWRLGPRGHQVAGAAGRRRRSSSSSPPSSRARVRRCSSSSPATGRPRSARAGGGPSRRRHRPPPARQRQDPGSALLGGDAGAYAECIRLGRIAWAALAVGTAQAALDYLIPYVNERKAFGEPISHRQAVAFNMSDIAIEIEGMRLATCGPPPSPTRARPFARETAVARQLCADRACRSAPTVCSCSAATATSRSTPSNAGTGTCGRPASSRERCSSERAS